jgi:putative phosphoribosyl transferase
MNAPIIFRDRVHAGQLLADALLKYAGTKNLIVLGLPRGGVPVAFEVARKLNAPLDVLVVRKLGFPGQEELAMGAIASGGVRVINEDIVRHARIPNAVIDAAAARELVELQRREVMWRGHVGAPEIGGRTVILVDDGIATGSTIRAAARALRAQDAAKIIIAAPVGAPDSCASLLKEADEVVTLFQPDNFCAVGNWYSDFDPTEDDEVARLLATARSPDAKSR